MKKTDDRNDVNNLLRARFRLEGRSGVRSATCRKDHPVLRPYLGQRLIGGVLLLLGAGLAGCGDDTAGSGGGGGSGTGSAGDGGASSSGATGPTSGPGSTGSIASSSASTSNTTVGGSTGSGAPCGTGDGTPDDLSASYRNYCEVATDLAADVCASPPPVQDCLDLESLILQVGAGCEAELSAQLDCISAAVPNVAPDACTCVGNDLECDGLGDSTCAAENAAVEACDECNG